MVRLVKKVERTAMWNGVGYCSLITFYYSDGESDFRLARPRLFCAGKTCEPKFKDALQFMRTLPTDNYHMSITYYNKKQRPAKEISTIN